MPQADEVTLSLGADDDVHVETVSQALSFGLGNGALFVLAVPPEVAFEPTADVTPVCLFAGGRLIDLPNGLALSWRHDAESDWFHPRPDQMIEGEHRLAMSDGMTVREALVEDDRGRQTRWREVRFVSLAHAHLILLRWELSPQNWSGPIVVRSLMDLRTQRRSDSPTWAGDGVPLAVHDLLPADGLAAHVTGPDGGPGVRVDVTLRTSGAPCRQAGRAHDPDQSYQQRRVDVPPEATVCIDVAMTVVTADGAASPAPPAAPGFDQELERHRAAWQGLWSRVQLSLPQDAPLERACRFNAFHLLQAVSPLSVGRDVGLPAWAARDGIPGHEAWDETMAMPFYCLHLPALARELLSHRVRRFDGASARPWQGAAPFSVWRHHLVTRDGAFLSQTSGDVLVTAARYWAAQPAAARSWMAAWVLQCAARLREHVDGEGWTRLSDRTGVTPREPAQWHDLSRAVTLPWQDERVLALPSGEGASTLLMLHLLGEDGANDLIAHIDPAAPTGWYGPTVRHHVAAGRAGAGMAWRVACAGALASVDPAASWGHFHAAVHAPLVRQAGIDDGLSFGAMGGVWDVLQRHYLGLQPADDGLHLRPRPPDALDQVTVRVCLAGQWLTVRLADRDLTLQPAAGAAPLTVRFEGESHVVQAEGGWTVRCR